MLATNASGPHSLGSGSVRDWVTALELVTATGDTVSFRRGAPPPSHPVVERFLTKVRPALLAARPLLEARFPKTRKNSSGYAFDRWLETDDLIDLIVGSEGTLGIITRAEWRLEAIPAQSAGIRVALTDASALDELVPRLLELHPSALEYLDATFLEFAGIREGGEAGLLMVEFEGNDGARLKTRLDGAREILRPAAKGIRSAYGALALDALWDVRHAASPMLARLGDTRRSLQVIEDACVPVASSSGYIEAVRAAGQRHGVQVVIFGHAGEGNLHVNLLPDVTVPGWEARVGALFEEVSGAVFELGGTLSGEHGDGRLRAGMLSRLYGSDLMILFTRLKQAFDPDGILNPGVIIPLASAQPLEDLKVGSTATQLPGGIESQLREIERTAGYGQFRLELASVR
jgi:FAD/FMN-containing dehydrogenase